MSDEGPRTAIVQGDLAMNLFMVLLSVLAALSITSMVISSVGFRKPLVPEVSDEAPMALAPGWAPVQQVRQRLAARPDGLWLIDLDGPARAMAEGKVFLPETAIDGSGLLRGDPDPQAHQLILKIGPGPLPEPLVAWHITQSEMEGEAWPAAWQAMIEEGREVDILVYEDAGAIAWEAAARLHSAAIPFRLLFQSRNWIAYQRSTDQFSFEDVYK